MMTIYHAQQNDGGWTVRWLFRCYVYGSISHLTKYWYRYRYRYQVGYEQQGICSYCRCGMRVCGLRFAFGVTWYEVLVHNANS